MKKTSNARRFDTTAGVIKHWCTQQGTDLAMQYYDYVRYSSTCGSRFCLGLNQVYGLGYAFGIVTEIGLGFNYAEPYKSADSVLVTAQCVE